MIQLPSISDVNCAGLRVLVRADLNVPFQNGEISDDARVRAFLPTLKYLLEKGVSQVLVMTHLGRPQEDSLSLEHDVSPVAEMLSRYLGMHIPVLSLGEAQLTRVACLQNVRGYVGERANDDELGARYAEGFDLFVFDAFGTAHRAEASTCAVARHVPKVCMGHLMRAEISALERVFISPKRPLLAMVGGAKVSSKLMVLKSLAQKVDVLIVGGGIANTFLKAAGFSIGASLVEESLVDAAHEILYSGIDCPLPIDVVCATSFSKDAQAVNKSIGDISNEDMILDIGPKTIELYKSRVREAGTIIWNGPVGVFEWPSFSLGTRSIAEAVASSSAYSLAGGGDTLSAIHAFDVAHGIDYQSTGGGAFLEFLEGKPLPAIMMLQQYAQTISIQNS